MSLQPSSPNKPIVYFDGGCPLCSAEIAAYQKTKGADNLVWLDLTQASQEELGPGLTREAALSRMHVRRSDGELVEGAEAFAEIWLSLPRWSWLGRLIRVPWILPMVEVAYRGFLKIRPLWRR